LDSRFHAQQNDSVCQQNHALVHKQHERRDGLTERRATQRVSIREKLRCSSGRNPCLARWGEKALSNEPSQKAWEECKRMSNAAQISSQVSWVQRWKCPRSLSPANPFQFHFCRRRRQLPTISLISGTSKFNHAENHQDDQGNDAEAPRPCCCCALCFCFSPVVLSASNMGSFFDERRHHQNKEDDHNV
jgi:streptolysin S family bacteriocin protoxin